MELPLIISDADGRLLYKSRSVKTDGFLSVWKKLNAKASREGLVFSGDKAFYVKRVSLCGKKYLFYLDYAKMGKEPFGFANTDTNSLFDLTALSTAKKKMSLSALAQFFANASMPELYSDGIRTVIHPIAQDFAVEVSPEAFVLSLSIMARLAANDGRVVKFSCVNECGRVTVFCDGEGSENVPLESRELLEIMLYEVAAAAGFAIVKTASGGKTHYSVELSPLDISLLGLKVEPDDRASRVAMAYAAMFL